MPTVTKVESKAERAARLQKEREDRADAVKETKNLEREIRRYVKRGGGYRVGASSNARKQADILIGQWNKAYGKRRTVQEGWDEMVVEGMK